MRPVNHFTAAFLLVWIAAVFWSNPLASWVPAVVLLVLAASHVAEGMRR